MRFRGTLRAMNVDIDAYIRELQSHLDDEMREFIKQWLVKVTGRIPLYSGLTRGSFSAVAQLVGSRLVLAPLKVKSRVPEGRNLGSATLDTTTPGLVKFVFESSAGALGFLDAKPGKSPTSPWGGLALGSAAFEKFSQNLSLPPPRFTTTPIRVG